MTTTAPDPWADAWQVATEQVLDRRLVAVRRRIWFREAMVLVAGCAVLAVGLLWLRPPTPASQPLWTASPLLVHGGVGSCVVGVALMLVANVRSSTKGLDRSLVGPDAHLPRSERAWVRQQVAQGRPVPAERRRVVIALARRARRRLALHP